MANAIDPHLQNEDFRFVLLKWDEDGNPTKKPFEKLWTCLTIEDVKAELKEKQESSSKAAMEARERAEKEANPEKKKEERERAEQAEKEARFWKDYEPRVMNYRYESPKLQKHIASGGNYGILTGVGGFMVLDSDDLDRWKELEVLDLIPKTRTVESRQGHRQFYINSPESFKGISLKDPERIDPDKGGPLAIGDLKSEGGQVVAPGCRHPSGSIYTVVDEAPIAEISGDALRQILSKFKTDAASRENVEWDRCACDHASPADQLRVEDIMPPAGKSSRNGEELRGDHPVHGSKNGGNYVINTSKNLWHCKRCNGGGGPVAAVAVKHGLIDCRQAQKGAIRGDLFKQVQETLKDKYADLYMDACINFVKEKTKDKPKAIHDPVVFDALDFIYGRDDEAFEKLFAELRGLEKEALTEEIKVRRLADPEKLRPRFEEDPRGALKDRIFLRALGRVNFKDPVEYALFIKEITSHKKLKGLTKNAIESAIGMNHGWETPRAEDETPGTASSASSEIDPRIREKAVQVLKHGDLVEEVLKYVGRKVYGGRDASRAIAYSAISVYMEDEDRLHADVIGSSQAGKSAIVGAVLEAFPKENVYIITEGSPKAIYYMAKNEDMGNLVIYLDDAREEHIGMLKSFRNESTITPRNITVSDDKEFMEMAVDHRPIMIASSVLPLADLEGQNTSRTFMVPIPEATKNEEMLIRQKIRERARLGGLKRQNEDRVLEVLHAAGRILRDEGAKKVLVPFDAKEPESANRRGTGQFLRLIKISAFINQHQRLVAEDENGEKYVLASYMDLENAAQIWFAFELGQKFKASTRQLELLPYLPTKEPAEDGDGATTSTVLMDKAGKSQKTIERYLVALYDDGLISRKQVYKAGSPYAYWTTEELRQNALSGLPASDDIESYSRQGTTNSACRKYMAEKSPDSLESSIKGFFRDYRHIFKSVYSEDKKVVLSPPDELEKIFFSQFLGNRVANEEKEPMHSESVRQDENVANVANADEEPNGSDESRQEENGEKIMPINKDSNLTQGLQHPYSESSVAGGKNLSKAGDVALTLEDPYDLDEEHVGIDDENAPCAPEIWDAFFNAMETEAKAVIDADTARVKEQIAKEGDDITVSRLCDALDLYEYEIETILYDELHWEVDENGVCRPKPDGESWIPSRQEKLDQKVALAGDAPDGQQSLRAQALAESDEKPYFDLKSVTVCPNSNAGDVADTVEYPYDLTEEVTGSDEENVPPVNQVWDAFEHVLKTQPVMRNGKRCVDIRAIAERLVCPHEPIVEYLEEWGCCPEVGTIYEVPEEFYNPTAPTPLLAGYEEEVADCEDAAV